MATVKSLKADILSVSLGLTLETLALKLLTVAHECYQLSLQY